MMHAALTSLAESLRGSDVDLRVVDGRPVDVVPQIAEQLAIDRVVCAADFSPYGRRRDRAVDARVPLTAAGSPYAVDPGTIRTGSGTPYQVFTPFFRAWKGHGTPAPAPGVAKPGPVEAEALDRLDRFVTDRIDGGGAGTYAARRDLPAVEGTSRLGAAIRWGIVHPRSILARLDPADASHDVYRSELAWREFYADVLWHKADSAWVTMQPKMRGIPTDEGPLADERFAAWAEGRTGYPIVDAGMRQLLGEGWMHNRLRMIVASFLVKDLHLDWQRGARHFLDHLVDGDVASNNHGWQWAAGTGTDAAPYFRIFNPTAQGKRFDPDGTYIRRWVPELASLSAKQIHQPHDAERLGYPAPIVDHAAERAETLRRFAAR
jgi:deoxyribodipyrimidine photo-lyase